MRGFSTGALALTIQFFGSFGMFFTMLQYLQYVAGRSPLAAAVALLPMPFVMVPVARNAPRVASRLGMRRVVPAGLVLSAVGLYLMSRLGVDLTYWNFAIALVVFAAGMGLAGTPATTAIVSSLPAAKQGVASAVNDTSRELGSALGIAILGSVLASGYRDALMASGALAGVPAQVAGRATSSIAFVQYGADQIAQLGPSRHDAGRGRPAGLRRRDGAGDAGRRRRAGARRCGRRAEGPAADGHGSRAHAETRATTSPSPAMPGLTPG